MKGYYFVTDGRLSRAGNEADVAAALAAGVDTVQYRCKDGTSAALYDEALRLGALCRGRAAFLVNDRVDIALAVDADGVHIGQDDLPFAAARRLLGPKKMIGLTVHSLDEALAGAAMGADYLGISPIFATGTKPDAGPPAGIALVRAIRARVKLPLVAIGGISLANAPAVIAAGTDAVCAISAVVCAADPGAQIVQFQELFSF
jgi:thiamine-phosphate pyrophosphorylase